MATLSTLTAESGYWHLLGGLSCLQVSNLVGGGLILLAALIAWTSLPRDQR